MASCGGCRRSWRTGPPELPERCNTRRRRLLATWLAFAVLLRAARVQTPWVLVAVGIGYGGARLGGVLLGPELGAFAGALVVALAANLFARWQRRPAAVVRTPGLLLLVRAASVCAG